VAEAGDFALFHPEKRELAPEIALMDLNGFERTLSEFHGDVVLLHFWATWCRPCEKEFPMIMQLGKMFEGSGLSIVTVAADSRKRVRPYAKKHHLNMDILIDQYGTAIRAYDVSLFPVSFIIDREGRIDAIAIGPRDYTSREAFEYFEGLLLEGHAKGHAGDKGKGLGR
jgi:peroxiredoxin